MTFSGAATAALAGLLCAEASAMTPNLFLSVLLGVGVCWLRWRAPWRR